MSPVTGYHPMFPGHALYMEIAKKAMGGERELCIVSQEFPPEFSISHY